MAEAMRPEVGSILRRIPAVDELLASPQIRDLLALYPRWAVLESVRAVLSDCRRRVLGGGVSLEESERVLAPETIVVSVAQAAADTAGPSLAPVINATGVVLHTNLGRAPLASVALRNIEATARGYATLEFDLATGKRGSRQVHVEGLLCALTGAEAALVVNNNAAAVFLAINTFASGKEIVVSRGQLVEIGDSFRIPDVMVRAGGHLREVGTTNRTHLRDYEEAIGPATALVLQVHRSNFQILGFTAEVESRDLVALARRHQLFVMEDLGSGALLDLSLLGLRREPMAVDAIGLGVDLVTFSGDKLLGGPQAGILVGRRDLIAQVRRNPLARAVRIDKLSLAGLEATLRLYREPERALQEIPVLRMLALKAPAIGGRAEALAGALRSVLPEVALSVEDEMSEVGGGALPLQTLPTRVLAVRPPHASATELESRLRRGRPPVLVRTKGDRVLLDLRTVAEAEEAALGQALRSALWMDRPRPGS